MPPSPLDLTLLDLCAAIHGDLALDPDPFIQKIDVAGVYVGIAKLADGRYAIVPRGTYGATDVLSDFAAAVPEQPDDYDFLVPSGFWNGCVEATDAIVKLLPPSAKIVGAAHSLAGPRLLYISMMLDTAYDIDLDRVVTFESPYQGNAAFKTAWQALGIPSIGYRALKDWVISQPPLEGMDHAEDVEIPLQVTPALGDFDPFFRYHHLSVVRPALARLLAAQGG